MSFGPSNNKRQVLTILLVMFVVVNVFGLILLLPTPAYAQWVVTDPITGANTTIRNIVDFVRVILIGVLGTAVLNGLWYFSQRIAYDTAIWVASGGKGQGALVFQGDFREYLGNVALDAVADAIGSIDNAGFDLCRPPDLGAILRIQLGIARRFQPPTPRCSWNELSQNWDAFVSSVTSGEVLEGLANSFRPGESGLEVAFQLGARSHEWNLRRQLEAAEDRREGGGYKPVLDIISGSIVTPSQAVREKAHEDLVKSESKQRELTNQQAASALGAGAFQLLPATLTIFANTLLSELTTKFFEGLFAPEPRRERGPLFTVNPEASGELKGRARAQAVFADLLTPKFVEVQNYDALTEFMTCPGVNRGLNNCVIDAALSSVIRISDAGVPLTVTEALKQGALHKDWRLIPSTDARNQDQNCYNEAYCYSNLVKLRRARILPVGWELAAEQGGRLGITPTLEEVMNHFYDCDPETGGASDTHPWCHLIDPNWVLKYPATQCRALVKGPTLLAGETSIRADTCVDAASCIAKDDSGNCVSYGYCTREQNIWQTPGESCPARYDSCQGYSKIKLDGKPDKEAFMLTNTLDFNGCSAEVAGCSWYSTARTGGVTANLVADPSFENANPDDEWDGVDALDHSQNGTQSFDGRSAYRVPEAGISQTIAGLQQGKTYTISFYAKQEAAAAVDHPVEARLIFMGADGAAIGDADFPLDGRTDAVAATTCNWNEDNIALIFSPGSLNHRRAECRLTLADGVGPVELRLLTRSPAGEPRHFVDAVQLEESARATFFHIGSGRDSGWLRDERVYFNRNVETCGDGDDGCTDLILKGAGISKNLLRNSSFEIDDDSDAADINFWTGLRGDDPATPDFHENYSLDGSQSFQGSAAIRVGDSIGAADGPLLPSEDIFLEPETTYTFSFYAKQSEAGESIGANAKMWLELADGSFANMSGRTDCPLVDSDEDGEPDLMVLRFIPGSSYSRSSCTFTTPPSAGSRLQFGLNLYGDEAFKLWVDAVQLEEGLFATEYREFGYPASAAHAYYRTPPDYLGCAGRPGDPSECANYTLMCTKEDTNCELYTPTDGSPAVPGIVTSDKLCPSECVGYSTFRQEETSFERAKYPLFFIAATGDKCEAQYAGCDEFTNLETTAVEYYSYLRQCIRPGAESATYYTWEGSDTTGFQLKVWNFKQGDPLAGRGEIGSPPEYRPGFTDIDACTFDIFRRGINPDCREFYDVFGNISYRLYSELIVSTPECNRYRRSLRTATALECEESGGTWDDALRTCTFFGYPAESRSCPAEKNGCRSYTGNAGRNFRVLKNANFEGGQISDFDGLLSSESVYVGGHSLAVPEDGVTTIPVGSGEARIRNGGTYLISFMAKGSLRPVIRFSGAGARVEKYFANASFELRNDWQRYSLGPVLVDWDPAEDETLIFSGLGDPTFIDDFELREINENIFLISDSWVTPEVCDQDSSGAPFPRFQLNCSEYRTTHGESVTLTGFDRLCSEAAVGCRAVIDTRNSVSLEEERFNLVCLLDQDEDGDTDSADACADLSCVCRAYVNGAPRDVCQVSRGESSCRFNSIGSAGAVDDPGVDYTVEVRPDSVIVPADETKYLILDESKVCRANMAGCTLYGKPETGVCSLRAACASPGGCNCAVSADVVCQVANGQDNCTYSIPRYFLDGDATNFGTIVLKNEPAKYGETLCTDEFLGCEEWQRGASGLAYFKDPFLQQCEYRVNVSVRGVNTNGWFKKGLEAEPCDPAFAIGGTEYGIRKNGDPQYLGWAGLCEREYAGCTAFLDPADSSDIYPEGRPYYIIKDNNLEEGNDCSGRVSQKEGCVLFKDTSVPSNQYSSEASYGVSSHNNYGLVPVSSCPGGAGCKRCRHRFEYNGEIEVGACVAAGGARLIGGGIGVEACQLDIYGATCVEDRDCERDIVDSPVGGNLTSSTCVDAPEEAPVRNDSNLILKVTRDRQCSEWLDCKTTVSVWDDQQKKFKKVCTQLGRCDSYVTTADGVKCANYKAAEYSGNVLSLDTYVERDVSWYGDEYSGYSIPQHYPVEELVPVDYDKTVKQDIRLAYVACKQGAGPDRNCDLRPGAPPGACRRPGFACGEPNSLGNRGTCVTSGGAGALLTCVYGIDGSSVPAQPDVKPRRDPATLTRALPPEQCRAYPEQDSPFPSDVSNWSQAGLPLSRIAGFTQANVCERFAWIDRDGDGIRDITPAYPDPRAELIPQNCECNYSKAIYNGKSFVKYYGSEEDKIPQGICQGGPRSGEPCVPGAAFSDKKPATDKENLKTCGPPSQSGICQKVERIDKVIGLSGQCLEQDLSLSLNGILDNYACLTWNPLGIVPGGRDIYNQYAAAGYAPSGSTGRYFCVESRGLAGNANQSYETMYTKEMGDARIGDDFGGGFNYREVFYSDKGLYNKFAGGSRPKLYEKDIAAIRLSTTEDWNDDHATDQAMKAAIEKAVEDGTNVLSRLGATGVTASGRYFWEATFNIPPGQAPPRAFVHENKLLSDAGFLLNDPDADVPDNNPETVDNSESEDNLGVCDNSFPGNAYVAVRALFDETPARRFLGLWTVYCANGDDDVEFDFDVNMHFGEACNIIAQVDGSNAAFTDRAWVGSGYLVSDEADITDDEVENMENSVYGDPPENDYEEFFMLGYGYENRNTPFGSAASTQEPFGAEAWQVNGPDGFGSPYLRYIPAAIDAGSPYGCFESRTAVDPESGAPTGASCGANLRCAGSFDRGQASLNEGKACLDRTGCPLQGQCTGAGEVTNCSSDADCAFRAGSACSAKHCRRVADGFVSGSTCVSDDDCLNADEWDCDDRTAFAECTDQFRPYGIASTKQCLDDETDLRVAGPCQVDTQCPPGSSCRVPLNVRAPAERQSPLEFLFAKSFGIWRWQPAEGTITIGQCVGGTPVDGDACEDDADCTQAGGACEAQRQCSGGPLSGVLNCNENSDCQGLNPDVVERTICSRGGDEFALLRCKDGPNAGDECVGDAGVSGGGRTYCYTDTAICNLATSRCSGGAFESPTIYTPPCPDGWIEEGGKCRLPCANDNECRYSESTCGAVQQCNADSGILSGQPCANDAQCNYAGSCNETTVTQPPGYQKLQDAPGTPAVGWDNRQTQTLGEQPYVPMIASPDISACETQSQRCRVQGVAVGVSNITCSVNADCPTGWTCEDRSRLSGANGDGAGTTCVPPRGLDTNALSINNRVLGDLRGSGSFRAILRFYAWADHNAMPITSRTVDWGDGLLDKTVNSRYQNHKAICSAGESDDSAAKECQGMPGLTCAKQADCPAGTGLCVPVGKCSISRNRCSVDDDCGLTSAGERCVLSRFGNAPAACDEQYFEFEHTYICNRDLLNHLPVCTGADLDPTNKNAPHASCARDLNFDGIADACMFRPKVQVRDNWGYCNGICPSVGLGATSAGGLRCFENECDVHPGAWTGFGGFITLTPRN